MKPLARLWFRWKAMRLPWRKRFLAGLDLQGNTYWEFRDLRGGPPNPASPEPVRWRRIVEYPRGTHPGAVQVPPVWHQWLRHVREAAPTIAEQQLEVARRQRIRALAAAADARWADARPVAAGHSPGLPPSTATPQTQAAPSQPKPAPTEPLPDNDPWKQVELARGAPGQPWQPAAWTPPPKR